MVRAVAGFLSARMASLPEVNTSDSEKQATSDSEKQAEFERQQFDLYEARRLAEEGHANTVVAAGLAVGGLVLADIARHHHRPWWLWVGFSVAMVGLLWVIIVGINARVVSWNTPRWQGGVKRSEGTTNPLERVKTTLDEVRGESPGAEGLDLGSSVRRHWRARADSAWKLGEAKGRRVRWSVAGFAGPSTYFIVRLFTS